MKNLVILKIGGSVITYKQQGFPRAKIPQIRRIAEEIKRVRKKREFPLILVHGIGSFGHPRAQKYRLWEGLFDKRQFLEFCRNNHDDLLLSEIFLKVMLSVGLPVFPVQPSAIITQSGGKIRSFNLKIIKLLLEKNFIPVLYGNVVLDEKLNGSICSGDTLVVYLARAFSAQQILFASDVEGIFDKDPKLYPGASLISKINGRNFAQIFKGVGRSQAVTDSGGGMRGKILEIKRYASGIPVAIFNGLIGGNIEKGLRGEELGTVIQL